MSKLPLTAGGAIDAVDNATVAVIRGGLPFDSAGKLVVTTSNAEADRQNGYSLDSARRIRVATSGTVARIQHGLAFDSQGRLIVTDVDPGQGIMRVGRRYSSAGSMFMAGLAFTPAALSGLAAWYDASKITGVADGAALSSFADSSGNGKALTQATVANQPIYLTSGINGLPALSFDGVNDFMDSTLAVAQPNTSFVVVQPNSTVTQNFFDGTAGRQVIYISNNNWRYFASTERDSFVPATTSPNMLCAEFNGPSSVLRLNGSQISTADPGPNNLGNMRLGRGHDGASPTNGRIAEIIFYDRVLSTAERQQVEGYLLDKYALRPPTGMAAWYDASKITGVSSGGTVSAWPDSSGNGRTLSSTHDATTRFTLESAGLNGMPTVRGGAASGGLRQAIAENGNIGGTGAVTGFLVRGGNIASNGGGAGRLLSLADAGVHADTGPGGLAVYTLTNEADIRIFNAADRVNFGNGALDQAAVLSFVGGTGTAWFSYLNGSQVQTSATTGGFSTVDTIGLFSNVSSTMEEVAGDIAEVILYNRALTTAERQQAERYLGAKYGITVA